MDNLTPEQRRKNMQNIRSQGTKPELAIIKELKRRKIYFAINVKKIYGKPDIVFRRKKIAIFIDSDFWHGHPQRFIMPKTNLDYWKKKLKRNKDRDILVNQKLTEMGWHVIRIWEYDIKKNLEDCVQNIIQTYESR